MSGISILGCPRVQRPCPRRPLVQGSSSTCDPYLHVKPSFSLSLSSHFILTLLSFLFSKNMNKAKNLKSKKSIQFLIIWKRKAFLQRSKVKYEFNVYRLHCRQRLTKDPLSCGSHVIHQCVFTCELYTHALLHVCPPCMCLHVAVRN